MPGLETDWSDLALCHLSVARKDCKLTHSPSPTHWWRWCSSSTKRSTQKNVTTYTARRIQTGQGQIPLENLCSWSRSASRWPTFDCRLGFPVSDRPRTCLSSQRLPARRWCQCSPTRRSALSVARTTSATGALQQPDHVCGTRYHST